MTVFIYCLCLLLPYYIIFCKRAVVILAVLRVTFFVWMAEGNETKKEVDVTSVGKVEAEMWRPGGLLIFVYQTKNI